MRTRDPAGKRRALIEAGLAVVETQGLDQFSVNRVVAEAQVAKGTFFHLFGDRAAYLTELHRHFHDELAADIIAAMGDLTPGRDRLVTGTEVYLQGCLRRKGTRALLVQAQTEPAIVEEIAARNRQFVQVALPDFTAMGRAHPAHAAQLWMVMAREVAVTESASGAALPDLRAALYAYLDGLDGLVRRC